MPQPANKKAEPNETSPAIKVMLALAYDLSITEERIRWARDAVSRASNVQEINPQALTSAVVVETTLLAQERTREVLKRAQILRALMKKYKAAIQSTMTKEAGQEMMAVVEVVAKEAEQLAETTNRLAKKITEKDKAASKTISGRILAHLSKYRDLYIFVGSILLGIAAVTPLVLFVIFPGTALFIGAIGAACAGIFIVGIVVGGADDFLSRLFKKRESIELLDTGDRGQKKEANPNVHKDLSATAELITSMGGIIIAPKADAATLATPPAAPVVADAKKEEEAAPAVVPAPRPA